MHNFGSNWVQITHFLQEIFSGKIDCYYCVPAVLYLTTVFQKNSQRPNHQKDCIILSQIWPELTFLPKTNLLEKLTNISLVFLYPVMLHNFKKILWEQIIRLHNFCPNCCLDWFLTIALHYAKMFLKISRAVNTSCVIKWVHIAPKGDFCPSCHKISKKFSESWNIKLDNFGLNRISYSCLEGNFLGKLTDITLV